MGKTFLYGQTLEKDITDLFSKLTVYCQKGMLVQVKSVNSSVVFESVTNDSDVATFENITPGYWDVTVVGVDNAPVKRIRIGNLDYTVAFDYFFATIDIIYPVGSVCTVTKGDTTYTAPNTSGTWSCTVYDTGVWTVTSSNNDRSTSSTVNIANDEEIVRVTLEYFESVINITYPEGSTCVVTDGDDTYYAPDTSGVWSCKVFSPGEWTVTSSKDEQAASKTVNITTNSQSSTVTLKYLTATINITYPVGSTCTVSNGKLTYTAPDTSGSWICVIPSAGTWLITATGDGSSKSDTVTITEDGQNANVNIVFFKAYITVIYPEGSVCTCSNGETVYYAPDTNGSYTFLIPYTGSWTVTCSNEYSGKSTYDIVDITSDGQSKNITLLYDIYLFNIGDECENITGGWKAANISSIDEKYWTPVLTISDVMDISMAGGSTKIGSVYPKNNYYDFSKHSSLVIETVSVTVGEISFVLTTDNRNGYDLYKLAYLDLNNTGAGTHTLDISEINQSCYLMISVKATESQSASCTISKIYLA